MRYAVSEINRPPPMRFQRPARSIIFLKMSSQIIMPRVGPRRNPKYLACPANVKAPQKGATAVTSARTCSWVCRDRGTMMDLPQWSRRPETKLYSAKIGSKTLHSAGPSLSTRAMSSA